MYKFICLTTVANIIGVILSCSTSVALPQTSNVGERGSGYWLEAVRGLGNNHANHSSNIMRLATTQEKLRFETKLVAKTRTNQI